MERNGVREVVRDGLGCAVVLAVLGIGGAAMLAGVAAHAHGARKKIEEKRTSAAVAQTLRDGSERARVAVPRLRGVIQGATKVGWLD